MSVADNTKNEYDNYLGISCVYLVYPIQDFFSIKVYLLYRFFIWFLLALPKYFYRETI